MLPRLPGLVLLLVGFVSLGSATPPAGTWKVMLPLLADENQASWLVRFEKSADAWTGSVLATAEGVPAAKVEDVRVEGETLTFTLKTTSHTLAATLKLGKADETRLTGRVDVKGKASPIVLEATRMTALDDFALAEEILARPETTRETFRAALTLLALAGPRKATLTQVDAWAKRAAKATESLGADQRDGLVTLASYLAEQDSTAFLAVDYAEKAEKLVRDSDPPIVRKRVLRVLAIALERSGKADEAKAVRARNDAIEILRLQPYSGKAKSVVLVENFTCVQQARCLATDLAIEGLERTYPAGEVVVLCEHLSVPGPDPLANPATAERERLYRPRGTPSVFVNGKPLDLPGGSLDDAQSRYDALVATINPLLEKPAAGTPMTPMTPMTPTTPMMPPMPVVPKLTLKATGRDAVEVQAEVSNLVVQSPNLRLRLAIVEEVAEYTGANGLPRHRNVVRDWIGGGAGLALLEKASSRTFSVDVPELRKNLQATLEQTHKATPFPGRVWPTDLKRLRVVAFIQNDESREVLMAVGVNVGE